MNSEKIIKHPKGAFMLNQVVAVDIISTLSDENNAFNVTLKNGQCILMRKCDTNYTAIAFIKEWEQSREQK